MEISKMPQKVVLDLNLSYIHQQNRAICGTAFFIAYPFSF